MKDAGKVAPFAGEQHPYVLAAIAVVEREIGKSLAELRTPDEIAAAFEAWPSKVVVDGQSCGGLGNYAPDLLHWLWRKGRLGKEVLRRVIRGAPNDVPEDLRKLLGPQGALVLADVPLLLHVWRYTDFPRACFPARVWRAMFRMAGFLSDGIAKPSRRRILYRGCTPEGRSGMSWTTERSVAERIADDWFETGHLGERGHVYRTVASPDRVLAVIQGIFRAEFEYIIDARSLPITLVETAKARLARIEREEAQVRRRFQLVANKAHADAP